MLQRFRSVARHPLGRGFTRRSMAAVCAVASAGLLLLNWVSWHVTAFSFFEDGECRTADVEEFPAFLQMGLNLQSLAPPGELREPPNFACPGIFPSCHGLPQICENASPNKFRLGLAVAGGPSDPDNLVLDLTNALKAGAVQILVMALFKQGAYTDDAGLVAERAVPLEDTSSTLLELRLSGDHRSINVYKPVMDLRTSDPQSTYSLRTGIGNGAQASLPRLYCIEGGHDRIIVDMSLLLQAGFFVVNTNHLGYTKTVIDAKEFPTNLDIAVEYGPVPLLRVGYTLVLLPQAPMQPRQNDDRLLYFDTQYRDKGSHHKQAGHGSIMIHSCAGNPH